MKCLNKTKIAFIFSSSPFHNFTFYIFSASLPRSIKDCFRFIHILHICTFMVIVNRLVSIFMMFWLNKAFESSAKLCQSDDGIVRQLPEVIFFSSSKRLQWGWWWGWWWWWHSRLSDGGEEEQFFRIDGFLWEAFTAAFKYFPAWEFTIYINLFHRHTYIWDIGAAAIAKELVSKQFWSLWRLDEHPFPSQAESKSSDTLQKI